MYLKTNRGNTHRVNKKGNIQFVKYKSEKTIRKIHLGESQIEKYKHRKIHIGKDKSENTTRKVPTGK